MRIALVHDYFLQDGGAERVLAQWSRMFPYAPVFTLLSDPRTFPEGFAPPVIHTSPLQSFMLGRWMYPALTPFMPMAAEHLDVSGFDCVLISSSSFAKGIIVPPHVKTICYLHTPTRFFWEERHQYARDRGWPRWARLPLHGAFHMMRGWDVLAAQRPTALLTNSKTSQARIRRYYGREAEILHPPIDLASIPLRQEARGSFWLTGGRLVPYKRFEQCILAANHVRAPLKIFGRGPDEARLRKLAGPTVEILGAVTEVRKHDLYRQAIGFLHPHVEDFGITILEALAHGTPVIARNAGGAQETIRHGVNGLHIPSSSAYSLVQAMQQLETIELDPNHIRSTAEPFDVPRFAERILRYVHTD